ncbi:hypothetical protein [Planctobacterium marinum]|uniref:Uncharacterized protein n=1 Tax=Planctobacterium marinum TaxID=1631968 RepID=A0AA48HWT0_9ALTE|nr:hypothetical protein MACH26_15460 [Planctobacterium marinum]
MDKLQEIDEKLNGIYGLVQEALTEDDVKVLMRRNNSLFLQIQNVELAPATPDWTKVLDLYGAMVVNYTDAAQHANDFLKHYESVNIHGDGYLIQYIGGFANTMCQFYSMYTVLQHTTNILLSNEKLINSSLKEKITERLTNEQNIIINVVLQFINQANEEAATAIFDFKYPSWCKNIFKQAALKIENLDGRNMKYAADSKDDFICLSQSYVKGTRCEQFKILFIDGGLPRDEHRQGMWEIKLQSGETAGFKTITQHHGGGYYATKNTYLVTDKEARFIIKYVHTSIIICLEKNGKASSSHLGAEPHHARKVWTTTKSYKWSIVSIN